MTTKLRKSQNSNFDSIKKEAELSLQKLSKIPTNSEIEMNNYVKNYNNNL